MTLKDLLRKKDKIEDCPASLDDESPEIKPDFTFVRSDTNTHEVISPPTFQENSPPKDEGNRLSRHFARLRTSSNASHSSRPSSREKDSRPSSRDKDSRRLSQRLSLSSHSRHSSRGSVNVPTDLPEIQNVAVRSEDNQAAWEERATILAKENPNKNRPLSQDTTAFGHPRSHPPTPKLQQDPNFHPDHLGDKAPRGRTISDAKSDDDLQEAIRLHEAGNLEASTAMFGRLAGNNAMAQILYGLALRHGWGTEADPGLGITYLSKAASNSASVEAEALHKGVKKGGAAKGELVLAIYELANSFRHGWGIAKDPVAAKKYYEVAANLGDTDAMNEVGRCYEEGYGGKKDRVSLPSLPSACAFCSTSMKASLPSSNFELQDLQGESLSDRLVQSSSHTVFEPTPRRAGRFLVVP
ncbi:uncharacterized protein KY384_004199 [Bacidia gigantensis]|uniref:uncharacterized protein n=1 Tax=Bacidia gigantensis TaxID=2732470 RepID=UPI001D0401D0|nr:uncharacterized protein KY384_004199 [Bacidia gigantensis]KAG8530842.1 hypothetical protein KY384_004199 [Bacidia gigantensis]